MSRWGVWTVRGLCAPRRTLIIQQGWHIQRNCRPVRKVGIKMEEKCSDLISHIYPSEEVSPGSHHVAEEVFVERPATSWGHLHWRTDTILPVGNMPRTHMVGGLLTSSGCPERHSHLHCQTGRSRRRPRAWPAAVQTLAGAPTICPSSSLLPSTSSPPHLSGHMSSGERVIFPGISSPSSPSLQGSGLRIWRVKQVTQG